MADAVLPHDATVLLRDVAVLPHDVDVLRRDVAVLMRDVAVLLHDVAVLRRGVAVLMRGHTFQPSFRFLGARKYLQNRHIDQTSWTVAGDTNCMQRAVGGADRPTSASGIPLVARPAGRNHAPVGLFIAAGSPPRFCGLLPNELINQAAWPAPKREGACTASASPATCGR